MITFLANLRSTRVKNDRHIHVDLITDSPPDTAELSITIDDCEQDVRQDVSIGPGNTATFSYQHTCEGRRTVTVKETSTGLETQKYLDLNASKDQ